MESMTLWAVYIETHHSLLLGGDSKILVCRDKISTRPAGTDFTFG